MAILDLKDSDFINGVVLERWQEPSACMFAVEFLLLRLSKVYYLRMGIIL